MPSFKPPQQFNFREPQGWPEWRSQFQRFGTASELTDKSGEVQTSSLIYSMGPEAEKIFSLFGLADAEANDFHTVIGRFNDYFEPKRNVIHERATFHKRNQKEGESVEEYIRHLYELSEHVDFADSGTSSKRGQELQSKQQAPEIAYRTVTSVHLLILDASVQLMGKCVKLATSQIISPDPELQAEESSQ